MRRLLVLWLQGLDLPTCVGGGAEAEPTLGTSAACVLQALGTCAGEEGGWSIARCLLNRAHKRALMGACAIPSSGSSLNGCRCLRNSFCLWGIVSGLLASFPLRASQLLSGVKPEAQIHLVIDMGGTYAHSHTQQNQGLASQETQRCQEALCGLQSSHDRTALALVASAVRRQPTPCLNVAGYK